jgi:hemolysin activation/secretion protein
VSFRTKLDINFGRLAAAVSLDSYFAKQFRHRFAVFGLLIPGLVMFTGMSPAKAQATAAPDNTTETNDNASPHFMVTRYIVEDNGRLATNIWVPIVSKYTGTNVSLEEIVKAASDVQAEYRYRGHPLTSIAVAQEQITNGVVTLNVFQTAIPQIVVSGVRYSSSTNGITAWNLPAVAPVLVPQTSPAPGATNLVPHIATAPAKPIKPATPAQLSQARTLLLQRMVESDTEKEDTRIHVISTNAGPRFAVKRYDIMGNTILSPQDMAMILTNIDGAFGTNVSFEGIRTVIQQLQNAYRDRGYVTVAVGLPRQKLTNEMVKVQVTEGRLTAIDVLGNRYFSSNNVMRALPSLHTNILLNGNVLQAELNRANANQDRQIYPVIGPGPDPGTSELTLHVKDQFPLHSKFDFNNQNTPETPALRLNASAVYNNLWQSEQSFGGQYSFSPQQFKPDADQWNFYDRPAVANYSAFYRIPLGNPEPAEDMVENNPSFGYSEATRKFNMPPLTGNPELTFFAGGSTINTGVQTLSKSVIPFKTTNGETNTVGTLTEENQQEDLTINNDYGGRLAIPLQSASSISSIFSVGLDYKTYNEDSAKTNIFTEKGTEIDYSAGVTNPIYSVARSPVPYTVSQVDYTPLSLRYDFSRPDAEGVTAFGLGVNVNLWYYSRTTTANTNGTVKNAYNGLASLQQITGSTESRGNWVVVTPSFSRNFLINNWNTLIRADGQWASTPLISNEQFGIGGVNSVRGYHEGQEFGDSGWHVSLEEDTPAHIVGPVYDGQPLTIQGLIYSDLATAYLIDPQGAPQSEKLWGTGIGLEASVSTHWQAQFLFSIPLISVAGVPRYNPYFNFSLTAQF